MVLPVFFQQYFDKKSIVLNSRQIELANSLNNLTKSIKKSRKFFIFKRKLKILGIYIHGTVGTGKTTLMDAYWRSLSVKINKYRIHFSEFMLEIHQNLFMLNEKSYKKDPIEKIAKNLAKKYHIILLDELEITDIADAMIVGRLFEKLFALNVIFVITSNKHPDELYENGLKRENFLPFIDLIKSKLSVFELSSGDYRLQKISSKDQRYFYSKDNDHNINRLIEEMRLGGSKYLVSNFDDLCNKPLGASDYLNICEEYDVIFLLDIPKLSEDNRNEAKRFTILIDTLYSHHKLLFCTAEVAIDKIYEHGDGDFEFRRTVSRLKEMQSVEYFSI
jgi:cell division protein ZapE